MSGPSPMERPACLHCGSTMARERVALLVHGRAAGIVGLLAGLSGLAGLLWTLWRATDYQQCFAPACLLVLGAVASARAPHLRCLQCSAVTRLD